MLALLTGCALVIFLLVYAQEGFFQRARCGFIQPLADSDRNITRFRPCTSVQQRIVKIENVTDQETEQAAWKCYVPTDAAKPGIVTVVVKREDDAAVFYPRTGGGGNAVSVYDVRGWRKRLLCGLEGSGAGWSAMGRQHSVPLFCADYAWRPGPLDITLEIVLTGKGAQLWHLGQDILF